MAANTKYWILPETGLKWYRATGDADPTAQNGSGFIYASDKLSTDSGASWTNYATRSYTIAVSSSDVPPPPPAVPEPALTSLLCFGGIALIRRRMKK